MISFDDGTRTFIVDTDEEMAYAENAVINIDGIMKKYFEKMPTVNWLWIFDFDFRDDEEDEEE